MHAIFNVTQVLRLRRTDALPWHKSTIDATHKSLNDRDLAFPFDGESARICSPCGRSCRAGLTDQSCRALSVTVRAARDDG